MNVLSCRCCIVVSCVHPVAVLNVAFCLTCSLLLRRTLSHVSRETDRKNDIFSHVFYFLYIY